MPPIYNPLFDYLKSQLGEDADCLAYLSLPAAELLPEDKKLKPRMEEAMSNLGVTKAEELLAINSDGFKNMRNFADKTYNLMKLGMHDRGVIFKDDPISIDFLIGSAKKGNKFLADRPDLQAQYDLAPVDIDAQKSARIKDKMLGRSASLPALIPAAADNGSGEIIERISTEQGIPVEELAYLHANASDLAKDYYERNPFKNVSEGMEQTRIANMISRIGKKPGLVTLAHFADQEDLTKIGGIGQKLSEAITGLLKQFGGLTPQTRLNPDEVRTQVDIGKAYASRDITPVEKKDPMANFREQILESTAKGGEVSAIVPEVSDAEILKTLAQFRQAGLEVEHHIVAKKPSQGPDAANKK
ncbi:MAG: hypothetical protein JWM96_1019 [Alphaproteobacteria bacterium]|nr:hypothetical protein [Alphaproteobacteria bacterium]